MSVDVVTNLLDEFVEIYEWSGLSDTDAGYRLRARGTARAIYVADKALMVLVEHNLGYDSCSYGDRTKDGGFEAYSFHEGRVRVVQRCGRCHSWDQKALLSRGLVKIWEHRAGEGCKGVGNGG